MKISTLIKLLKVYEKVNPDSQVMLSNGIGPDVVVQQVAKSEGKVRLYG